MNVFQSFHNPVVDLIYILLEILIQHQISLRCYQEVNYFILSVLKTDLYSYLASLPKVTKLNLVGWIEVTPPNNLLLVQRYLCLALSIWCVT